MSQGWLRIQLTGELHERLAVAATAEGLLMTSFVRRAIVLALRREELLEQRARYRVVLELIGASRAVDPEVLRRLARRGLAGE